MTFKHRIENMKTRSFEAKVSAKRVQIMNFLRKSIHIYWTMMTKRTFFVYDIERDNTQIYMAQRMCHSYNYI